MIHPGWSSIFEKSTDWVSYYFPGLELYKRESWNCISQFFLHYYSLFPAIALAVLVIATPCVGKILQCCFRNDFPAPEGVNTTLKTFVNGSPTEVKEVIG